MAVLKCKMCGGDVMLSQDKTYEICDFCGSTMTFPKVNDEQRAARFNRGNQFRRMGEFDKALSLYERLVQEEETDAEAHWCCALCRFGIEYVEDPTTLEYLPTCHRVSFDSFLEDVDYLAALNYSDGITRRQYQKDAAKIAEVQRGILATSQNEEPFDVFICYKESENDGSRTRDSLMAQDIYYQLTEQGRRVFFARITLEDKAGTEYEPYIFAALNSAKVMIMVTTSPEHVNAVWVKNEWSRFLALMRKDRTKLLLPCYRDMDPYDLPEALSVLQSYDMGKIGFIQDLIRGVNKVLGVDRPKETAAVPRHLETAPLLKRAFMFLEDREWQSADEYCEKVLDLEPENAEAYLGKLMAELHVRTRNAMKDQSEPFDERNSYQKAIRFGNETLKKELTSDVTFIKDRNETARKESIYQSALADMNKKTEQGYRSATIQLDSIKEYKDADDQIVVCEKCIEEIKAKEQANRMEAEKEADMVIDAITAKRFSKQDRSLEQQLIATKQEVADLEKICDNYDNVVTQVNQLNAEKTDANNKLYVLHSKRDSLGLFAMKEKKLLDGEISDIVDTIKQIDFKMNSASKQLGGFASKADANIALAISKSRVSSLQAMIDEEQRLGINKFSYGQSIRALVSKPYVLQLVNEKLPKLISSYEGLVTITFGHYPRMAENELSDIEWLVLKIEGSKALLISKYALDCQQYNTLYDDVTWETCSLRKWLNEMFLNTAFSSDEQNCIISSTVAADKNPSYSTSPGKDTTDKVFLLSIVEVNKYLSSTETRKCAPTDYAITRGAWTSDSIKTGERATCWWWLRSPGCNSYSTAYVYGDGSVYDNGYRANYDIGGVRPALWIDLE